MKIFEVEVVKFKKIRVVALNKEDAFSSLLGYPKAIMHHLFKIILIKANKCLFFNRKDWEYEQ